VVAHPLPAVDKSRAPKKAKKAPPKNPLPKPKNRAPRKNLPQRKRRRGDCQQNLQVLVDGEDIVRNIGFNETSSQGSAFGMMTGSGSPWRIKRAGKEV
jgi:hypothetical protein